MTLSLSNSSRFILGALGVAALAAGSASAAPFVWDGGDGLWADSNWNGGGAGPGTLIADDIQITIATGGTVDATAATIVIDPVATASSLTIDSGSTLQVSTLELKNPTTLNIVDGFIEVTANMRIEGNNTQVEFTKGLITYIGNDLNMFTGSNFGASTQVNFIGAAGEAAATLDGFNTANDAQDLLGRVIRGYFSIDDQVIRPADDLLTDASSVADLNTYLATKVVNGRFLEVSEVTTEGQESQTVALVPEPGSLSLLGLGGLLVARRRRI